MSRGDKSSYSPKQRREAEHIEESYRRRGASAKKAARIAWATVNKQDGGARGPGAKRSIKSGAKRGSTGRAASGRKAAAKR